jgi:hypothetical protein
MHLDEAPIGKDPPHDAVWWRTRPGRVEVEETLFTTVRDTSSYVTVSSSMHCGMVECNDGHE